MGSRPSHHTLSKDNTLVDNNRQKHEIEDKHLRPLLYMPSTAVVSESPRGRRTALRPPSTSTSTSTLKSLPVDSSLRVVADKSYSLRTGLDRIHKSTE